MPALDRKWWTLIAVCTATFMLLLDITVVNVALPDIQQSLHASFSDLQWVVDAYSLTLAAFLLTAGVAGDIYGRRKIFAIGLIIFSAASLVWVFSKFPYVQLGDHLRTLNWNWVALARMPPAASNAALAAKATAREARMY